MAGSMYLCDSVIIKLQLLRFNQIPRLYFRCLILVHRYTGCPDQIVRSVNFILIPNQKTCRKCRDSFEIVKKRATINAFS